jgi:hypothetical protein
VTVADDAVTTSPSSSSSSVTARRSPATRVPTSARRVELAPLELLVAGQSRRRERELREVAQPFARRGLGTPLALQRDAEEAHVEAAVAVRRAVGDAGRDRTAAASRGTSAIRRAS